VKDPFQRLRDKIAEQAQSENQSHRAGSRLMQGALDSVIAMAMYRKVDETSEEAIEIAIGLVDAMAMVMASILTHLPPLEAVAMADRLNASIGHVLRAKSAPEEGKGDGRAAAKTNASDSTFRGSNTGVRRTTRPGRRPRARDVHH
jgi:hypothetical protein